MAAITTSVALAVGSAAYGKSQQDKATGKAEKAGKDAARQSAEFLANAGTMADKEILMDAMKAAKKIGEGSYAAERRLAPFAGSEAFDELQSQTFNPQDLTGPLARAIASGSRGAVEQFNRSMDTSGATQQAVSREAMLNASGALPSFTSPLLNAAQEEIATAGDISGIRRRGYGAQSDIASSTAANRASALVGQAPQLADIINSSQQNRLLADVARGNTNTQALEGLAQSLGQIRGRI